MKKSDSKRQAILAAAYRRFRSQGFDKTSIAEITSHVGGSKATIYSHFTSNEEFFVECMMAAAVNYMEGTLKRLEVLRNPEVALREFGSSVLNFICSPEHLEVRRLMISEAARSGTGKQFFDRITLLRARVATFLAECMSSGALRPADPQSGGRSLRRALLEAEILEPLLVRVREGSPDESETARAAQRAVVAFLRTYAPPRADLG